ncbi:MAG: hypothetical protein HUU50_13765 [Candidatus Brocadiae bacterium]|nr:hypothetical protein [Candidatus Brocadiia bacterium]
MLKKNFFFILILVLYSCSSSNINYKNEVCECDIKNYNLASSISESEILNTIQEGDVLIRLTNHPSSLLIALGTLGIGSHSGICHKVKQIKQIGDKTIEMEHWNVASAYPTLASSSPAPISEEEKKLNSSPNLENNYKLDGTAICTSEVKYFIKDFTGSDVPKKDRYEILHVILLRPNKELFKENKNNLNTIIHSYKAKKTSFDLFSDYTDESTTYCSKFVIHILERYLNTNKLCGNDYNICSTMLNAAKGYFLSQGIKDKDIKSYMGSYSNLLLQTEERPAFYLVTPGGIVRSCQFQHIKTWTRYPFSSPYHEIFSKTCGLFLDQINKLKEQKNKKISEKDFQKFQEQIITDYNSKDDILSDGSTKEDQKVWNSIKEGCFNNLLNTINSYESIIDKKNYFFDSDIFINRLIDSYLQDRNTHIMLWNLFLKILNS